MKSVCLIVACLLSFGCASGVSTTVPVTQAVTKTKASVTKFETAQTASPPSGKAKITHLARGQNAYIGHLWIAPNAGVPLHRDPTEEYLYVLEGGGVLTMNDVDYTLTPGVTVFMPAGAQVKYTNGNAATVVLQVFAGPSSADKYKKWTKQ